MNSVTALNVVRDSLRTNLVDPIVTAGGTARDGSMWIYGNEPVSNNKFPRVELRKIDNPTENISIGSDYTEHERLFIEAWFYTKNGFKITVGGVEYSNAQLVEYYQGLIKTTLKAQFNALHALGVGGYRHLNTTRVEYDPETQLYYGNVLLRVWYFNR